MTTSIVDDILGPAGAIARRLGDRYEPRPEQLEMATAVGEAINTGHHLLVEAGTGVGKSFAYLIPAIDYAVKNKKRVVISTHTIALQEQLIEKDIPLLQAVYPDEFTAVLVKGRGNYLCQRRLEQSRVRQNYLFETEAQKESLWAIEDWAQSTTDGSLSSLPQQPDPAVWEKVNAEAGNCLGKKCKFYEKCHWQAAKRRMTGGTLLIVNHALFFSDLALRMAGVNYLPKYDAVIFDEAHTLEDVAGQHFGIKITESNVRYQLRTLFDAKRGKGVLSVHGAKANDAIRIVLELHDEATVFFDQIAQWQEKLGRSNGRVHEANVVPNDLSPKLRDLAKFLRELLTTLKDDEEISEMTSLSAKVSGMAEALDAIVTHKLPDAVYWFEVTGRTPKRVSLHAAPIDVAEGLRTQLFDKLRTVVATSATLCTAAAKTTRIVSAIQTNLRGTGVPPVSAAISKRQGASLPHWTKKTGIYSVTFRLADSIPHSVYAESGIQSETAANAELSGDWDAELDSSYGECWLKRPDIAETVSGALAHFDGAKYSLLAWALMPNHVHLVFQALGNYDLPGILHSIKSWTAKKANDLIGRTGAFWQQESYDHLILNEADLKNQVHYVLNNPVKAGLANWKWVGSNEDRLLDLVSESKEHGRDARATKTDDGTKTQDAVAKKRGAEAAPAFAFIKRRLGAGAAKTLQLGSPFDYASQATLYIENDLPEPSDQRRYMPAACEKIFSYLKKTHGGAFVLFTSYKTLLDAANALKHDIESLGLPLLVQGQGASRKNLIDQFRALDDAVLFGTSSFWQGIDVQGEKLRNVIIVKLPFAVPDEPLTEARLEAIERQGGNPFMELSVPEAVIRLKQGFGRLIRSKSDKGIVVLLDSRVRTKRYGKVFLDALPPCRVVDVGARGQNT